jgi:hypothetical protein
MAIVALSCGALEVFARKIAIPFSADLSRIRREVAEAQRLSGEHEALVVGNSLLLWGIDFEQLNRSPSPPERLTRLAIQQTTFSDWHFGLRRVLGSRPGPATVLLALEPRHITADGVRGDFFAFFLMRPKDIFSVAQEVNATPTRVSEFLLSHMSAFYAIREELRKFLLLKAIPDLPLLTDKIAVYTVDHTDPTDLSSKMTERLATLRAEVESHGTRLVLLVMPPVNADQALVIRRSGKIAGVDVMIPMTTDDLTSVDFQPDGYHLSDTGRFRFTEAVKRQLTDASGDTHP